MTENIKVQKTVEQKIEENRKNLENLLRKKQNLENNILQIENRIRNLEISLAQKKPDTSDRTN